MTTNTNNDQTITESEPTVKTGSQFLREIQALVNEAKGFILPAFSDPSETLAFRNELRKLAEMFYGIDKPEYEKNIVHLFDQMNSLREMFPALNGLDVPNVITRKKSGGGRRSKAQILADTLAKNQTEGVPEDSEGDSEEDDSTADE